MVFVVCTAGPVMLIIAVSNLFLTTTVSAIVLQGSLVSRLLDIFNVHEIAGEPGIQSHVTNITPHTKVGRVAGHDK